MLLNEKVALITGAASGLGRAQAIEYVKEGAKVIISDVNAIGLVETEKLIKDMNGTVLSIVARCLNNMFGLSSKSPETFGTVDICVDKSSRFGRF